MISTSNKRLPLPELRWPTIPLYLRKLPRIYLLCQIWAHQIRMSGNWSSKHLILYFFAFEVLNKTSAGTLSRKTNGLFWMLFWQTFLAAFKYGPIALCQVCQTFYSALKTFKIKCDNIYRPHREQHYIFNDCDRLKSLKLVYDL